MPCQIMMSSSAVFTRNRHCSSSAADADDESDECTTHTLMHWFIKLRDKNALIQYFGFSFDIFCTFYFLRLLTLFSFCVSFRYS